VVLTRRAVAEFIGTAFLLVAVVGSGIAAQRLSPGDVGLELLENALATGAALIAIILAVGSVSGAHLNPVITVVDALLGGLPWRETPAYVTGQVSGGIVGTVIANLMFGASPVSIAQHARSTGALLLGEVVATMGLVIVVFGVVRSGRAAAAPFAVGAYIFGAYFFTSSTSFANPAVTVARSLSDSFAGIAPASVLGFIVAQVLGGALGLGIARVLWPTVSATAKDVVVAHGGNG
jgi:arsenate reductase